MIRFPIKWAGPLVIEPLFMRAQRVPRPYIWAVWSVRMLLPAPSRLRLRVRAEAARMLIFGRHFSRSAMLECDSALFLLNRNVNLLTVNFQLLEVSLATSLSQIISLGIMMKQGTTISLMDVPTNTVSSPQSIVSILNQYILD